LALLGLGTASVAVGTAGWITGVRAPSSAAGRSGQPLPQPSVLTSSGGVLDLTLTAAAGVRLAGRDTSAWGYNGTSPGPTLRLRPGDLLRVRLTNHIPLPTNLHTHGLRVSPGGNSDNPFVAVEPGASFDYAIKVPSDHPAGTYWYHPHHHGGVAEQVFAGLVGALLIQDEPDLPVTDDLVLMISDTSLDGAGRVVAPAAMAKVMGREGDLVLVNGEYQPTISAAPGAVQRWRIVNACTSRVLALRLDNHELTQVALDGVFLASPVQRDRVELAPGGRADILVRPTGVGRFRLMSDAYDRGGAGMMGPMAGGPATTGPVTIATLVVTGPPTTTPAMPAALPVPTALAGRAVRQRQLTLAMGMGMGMNAALGMSASIDGRTFDQARDDQTVHLGDVEEWTITNTSPMDHPFHLHAWPFQVLATSRPDHPTGIQQDVVLVPRNGWVRLRIPFTDYPGRSVYHCHVLDHEDLGMMGTVNVRL
jgi:FtsP/CotA-like multicopper oxidase with cupredoxin domain